MFDVYCAGACMPRAGQLAEVASLLPLGPGLSGLAGSKRLFPPEPSHWLLSLGSYELPAVLCIELVHPGSVFVELRI